MKKIRKQIDNHFAERALLEKQLKDISFDLEKHNIYYENALKARAILQLVAKGVQEHLQDHFSKLVSMALEAVYGPKAYKFVIRFEEKRGKTEAKLLFKREGYEVDPLSSSGGGMIDVACLALRIAFLILSSSRRILLLDEPAKNVQESLHKAFGLMIKKLSKELGIQFIIISHLSDLVATGDRIIEVTNDGTSHVEIKE